MTIYRLETRMSVVSGVVGVFVLILLAGIVMKPAMGPEPLFFIAATLLLGSVLLRLALTATAIEIDTEQRMVRKVTGSLFRKKRRSFPLRDISSVRLIEKDIIIEDGYGVTFYTIMIDSRSEWHELFSTNDEAQGRKLYRELVAASAIEQKTV